MSVRPDDAVNAQQNHWSESGRAASLGDSVGLDRPLRSVLSFGRVKSAPEIVPLKKLSAVLIEMAGTILRPPQDGLSTEAGHAALLLAHVGWNREIDPDSAPTREQYQTLLKEFAESKPDFAKELMSDDFEALIGQMRVYKRSRYPTDTRLIVVCGITPRGNVHVESKE